MAIVTGSIERARLKYPDLDTSNLRVIGWGAGQHFRDYYPLLGQSLKLEYTICPNPENQGKHLYGVEVKPPDSLLKESPENVLIVIFSNHHSEVIHQIVDQYSDFRAVVAMDFNYDNATVIREYQSVAEMVPRMSFQRKLGHTPKFGIFVQGLAFPCTPAVLAWNRLRFPDAYQCMTTWDHLPDELLDRCRPWLDELILVPQPEHRGPKDHRNYVFRSARISLEHLAEKNIEFAIRCRSDNFLTGSIQSVVDKFFVKGRNKGKIALSLRGAWQYIPFHFSEKAMVARTKDMLDLWSVPEDPRHRIEVDTPRLTQSGKNHFQELRHHAGECYLWSHYAHQLGFPADTLQDSYRFAQSRLLALEPQMGWYSLRDVPLFNVQRDTSYGWSSQNWNRLFSDGEDALSRASEISSMDVSIDDFWQRKVG
ncbi:hypothetical protein GCM10007205_24260 [Oxalicibacterium flavum]|uniref:Uncharacterized protein n=1 Tax=Oxalicibacterium flavum TaxID=179467 RepID=A0A8J2ULS2_9BURK|nr:hypothetical protein [Oxalicibacterium flavum]GGC14558.1 hypothetical protein GCM10007205_24260 [Oxalicibacterium flavum]